MSEWQPIETAPTEGVQDVILWNGVRVFVGWRDSTDGWHDSTVAEHHDFAEDPRPTHWHRFPEPPVA